MSIFQSVNSSLTLTPGILSEERLAFPLRSPCLLLLSVSTTRAIKPRFGVTSGFFLESVYSSEGLEVLYAANRLGLNAPESFPNSE